MHDPGQPLLTVAVCTRDRSALLGGCLSSLVGQATPGGFEVLVVDDGSLDGTPETVARIAAEAAIPVRHVRQEHAGLNAARNRAVAEARGVVIHFLDDDELAPPGHLARVLAHFERDPGIDGVGGPTRDHGGGLRTCPGCSLGASDIPGEGVREAPRLLGGNMALRQELFRQVGPFAPQLSGRGDETEWFHRASGRRFVQDPALWVWHRKGTMGLLDLCRQSYRQGRALPLALRLEGRRFHFRPLRVGRYALHGLLRRCARGWWLVAREFGGLAGCLGKRDGATSPRRAGLS